MPLDDTRQIMETVDSRLSEGDAITRNDFKGPETNSPCVSGMQLWMYC